MVWAGLARDSHVRHSHSMRSVFDQYSQPENRLTHALACALHHEPALLRPFLHWLGAADVPKSGTLMLVEQSLPGEEEPLEEAEVERRGLPDLCVYTDDGWAIAIEAKVQSKLGSDQLRRHRRSLERRGFVEPQLAVLEVDPPSVAANGVARREWRELYAWLRKRDSFWTSELARYMETFELRMINEGYSIRGTVTMFDGLRFDDENPYSYGEGKRLLRLMLDELRKRPALKRLGIDPAGKGRTAITRGDGGGVWDYIPLRAARGTGSFTDFPHFTLGLQPSRVGASITVPNGIKGGLKKRLREDGPVAFVEVVTEIESNVRPVLKRCARAKPVIYALQRHYPHQRSSGVQDASLECDLRTCVHVEGSAVKQQPQWLDAIHDALANKRSNIQFGVSMQFPYSERVVRTRACLDLIEQSWTGMRPLIEYVLGG